MNCPICNIGLVMADKQGVEIDYCPKCRGIWLDRGELEKIIERSYVSGFMPQTAYGQNQHDDHSRRDDNKFSDHDDHRYPGNYKHGRKKNFLSDLFDF